MWLEEVSQQEQDKGFPRMSHLDSANLLKLAGKKGGKKLNHDLELNLGP